MWRFDHLIQSKTPEATTVNGIDKSKNKEKLWNSPQELQSKLDALNVFLKVDEKLANNKIISELKKKLLENLSMIDGGDLSETFAILAQRNISEISVIIDAYIQGLPSVFEDSTNTNSTTQGNTPVSTWEIPWKTNESTSITPSIENIGNKDKVIERLDLYLNYLKIKGENNKDLAILISEYKNYLKMEYTSFQWESENIFSDIEKSIKVITEKKQVANHLISISKSKLDNLSAGIDARLDKWRENVIKNAVEVFWDHSITPEFWSYFNAHALHEAMEEISLIDWIDDIQKVKEYWEKLDISTLLLTDERFKIKKSETLDSLEQDSSEDIERDKIVQDLAIDTRDSFIEQFKLLENQLKTTSNVIDLWDLWLVPFDSPLEREKALVSTMMIMEALSKTPTNKLVLAYEAMFNLAEDGIDITNIGILDVIFVDLLDGWAFWEVLSATSGGVLIMYLMMKRNPFAKLEAQWWRGKSLTETFKLKNKGEKKSDFQIKKEYFSLPDDKKEAFLESHKDRLNHDDIVEIENRKKVLDYVLDKYTKWSDIHTKIDKFWEKYLVMWGKPEVFYRLLNDIENYWDMKMWIDIWDTYKNWVRLVQPARLIEYFRKNRSNPEANLTKEQYLDRANKSFIRKIWKLGVDRSDDLMKLFDDELWEKPTNEKIKTVADKAKELNDAISKILTELNSTSKGKDTSGFETEIKDNLNKAIDDALNGSWKFEGKVSDIIYDANELTEDIEKKLNSAKSIKWVNKKIDGINITSTQKDTIKKEIEKAYNKNKTPEFLVKAEKIIESVQSIIDASENDKLWNEIKTAVWDKLWNLLDNMKSVNLLEWSITELQSEIDVLLWSNWNNWLIEKLSNLDASLQAKAYEKIKEWIKDERDVKITNIDQSVDNIIKVESTMRQNVSLDFAKSVINDQLKQTIWLPSGDFEILNNRLTKLAGLLDTVDSDFKALLEKSVAWTNIDWSIMSKVDNLLSSFEKEKRFSQDIKGKGWKLTQSYEVEKLAAKIEFLEWNGENVDNLKIKLSDLRTAKGLPDVTPAPTPKPQPGPRPTPDVLVINTDKLKDIIKNNPALSGRTATTTKNKTSILIKINGTEERIGFDLSAKNIDDIFKKLESLKTEKDLTRLLQVAGIEIKVRPAQKPKLTPEEIENKKNRPLALDYLERAQLELQLAWIQDPKDSLKQISTSMIWDKLTAGEAIDISLFKTAVGQRLNGLWISHIRERKELVIEFAQKFDNFNQVQLDELKKLISSWNLKDISAKYKGSNFIKHLLWKAIKKT